MSIQTLEQKETEGNEKEEKLRGEIQQLRDENHQLSSQVDVLEQHSAEAAQALQQQQQQQQQPAGVSAEQVEEIKAQLQAAHANERKTLTEELQAERSAEVAGLKGQYEAELHSVKEELSRVLRTWEEEKSSAEKELASETAEKRVREWIQCTMYLHVHVNMYIRVGLCCWLVHIHVHAHTSALDYRTCIYM